MKLKFLFPYWGSEGMSADDFVAFCVREQFDGIEVNFPSDSAKVADFKAALTAVRQQIPSFKVMAQQVLSHRNESAEAYAKRMLHRMEELLQFEPDHINSHTGKDSFSFEENSAIVQLVNEFEQRHGVPVLHEIHRGRFTFHAPTLRPYLDRFPDLKLTGDFSHWCLVSESLLEDQIPLVERTIPHIHHLHARIGTQQASQVNDPFAPEWANHVSRFLELWQKTVDFHRSAGRTELTITPEFGPFPYMPQSPFDQHPLCDQKVTNLKMRTLLIDKLNCA